MFNSQEFSQGSTCGMEAAHFFSCQNGLQLRFSEYLTLCQR